MLRVSTKNVLAGLTESQIRTGLTTAPGYSRLDLVQGDLGQVWRSSGGSIALSHTYEFGPGVATSVNFAAVFGLGVNPAPVEVHLFRLPDFLSPGSGSLISALTVGPRGDAAAQFPTVNLGPTEGLMIVVTYPSARRATMALAWAGTTDAIARNYATRRDGTTYHAIRNVSEAQSVFAHELADFTERLDLGFGRLTLAEVQALRAMWHATRGGTNPAVILPDDSRPGEVYHGRFDPAFPVEVDWPEHRGVRLVFNESGRALHG